MALCIGKVSDMELRLEQLQETLRTRLPKIPLPTADISAWTRSWRSAEAPETSAPRRLGVALSGGGGKGGAHLGVLAVLEELNMPVDLIVGTSIGGAVGIFYAAGLSLDEIAQVFHRSALRRVATTDPTRTGFIGVRKREALLYSILGDRTFADLRIPCAVVAVDLISGHEVVINEGPLVPAILATTAIPGILTPVTRGDELLADGSILNDVPVDVAEQLGAERVIAVQLGGREPDTAVVATVPENAFARLTLAPRQFALANRALGLLIAHATEQRLAQHPPALLLRPNVAQIATLDMTRPEFGRELGETAARAASDSLVALRDWRLGLDAPRATPAPRPRGLRLPEWLGLQQ
jgi:NTE family protein